jgi:hypothetical protein
VSQVSFKSTPKYKYFGGKNEEEKRQNIPAEEATTPVLKVAMSPSNSKVHPLVSNCDVNVLYFEIGSIKK